MTEPARLPPGVDALIRSLVGGSGEAERDQRASTFARGLALGALVGAAIAGSTIWQRRLGQRAQPAGSGANEPVASGIRGGDPVLGAEQVPDPGEAKRGEAPDARLEREPD